MRIGARNAACVLAVSALLLGLPTSAKKDEPEVVVVQHILIGYKGSIRGKEIERTKKEAKALALELLERAKKGEDFAELVQEYTDDRAPGIYKMANKGQPRPADGYGRDDMAYRFGDVAFSLEIGEIGLAEQHPAGSPYGWHIIKRLE